MQDSVALTVDSTTTSVSTIADSVAAGHVSLVRHLGDWIGDPVSLFTLLALVGGSFAWLYAWSRRRMMATARASAHASTLVPLLEEMHTRSMHNWLQTADAPTLREFRTELDRLQPRILALAEMSVDCSRKVQDSVSLGLSHFTNANTHLYVAHMAQAGYWGGGGDTADWARLSLEQCEISLAYASNALGRVIRKRMRIAAKDASKEVETSLKKRKTWDK